MPNRQARGTKIEEEEESASVERVLLRVPKKIPVLALEVSCSKGAKFDCERR